MFSKCEIASSYNKSHSVFSNLLPASKHADKPTDVLCYINLTLGNCAAFGTPLIIPCGAGGYIEQTFKAVPSPYVHYDNLLSSVPDSGSVPFLARGNNFISASISTVINTTSKQFRGNGTQLTSFPIIKGMLNTHTSTRSAWNREKCFVPNSYALGWKWSGPGFVLCHHHINLIIDS